VCARARLVHGGQVPIVNLVDDLAAQHGSHGLEVIANFEVEEGNVVGRVRGADIVDRGHGVAAKVGRGQHGCAVRVDGQAGGKVDAHFELVFFFHERDASAQISPVSMIHIIGLPPFRPDRSLDLVTHRVRLGPFCLALGIAGDQLQKCGKWAEERPVASGNSIR
jgi:hypothetical protein